MTRPSYAYRVGQLEALITYLLDAINRELPRTELSARAEHARQTLADTTWETMEPGS